MERKQLRLLAMFKDFLEDLFNLHEDKEREEITIAEIKKGVVFRGANLWILIFAIFIASIGLNVNSTAVIIGAMLISPLMGPIMGIGLGAGINDFELIKKAFRNLSIAATLSIMTSTLYFFATPLHEAQSELLARTTPTLWDVLIAFFGGLAGIVAGSRKEKSNAIPGVAIATALMPPLCTAGYGIANGNLYYFIGALYLFFINSVFISVSTFLIVRFLKYPKVQFESAEVKRRVKTSILVFVIITAVPSIYLAYNVVKRTIFEQSARNFINVEFGNLPETQVISQDFKLDGDQGIIDITLYGRKVEDDDLEVIRSKMPEYRLFECDLRVRQGYQEDFAAATAQEFQRMSADLKMSIVKDLYEDNDAIIQGKDMQIAFLENEIAKYRLQQLPIDEINTELKIQYPKITNVSMGNMITGTGDTLTHAVITSTQRMANKDKEKIGEWLRVRAKADSIITLFN
jgi:uncharacterized hydrophobic protein (TIGR00271 family)